MPQVLSETAGILGTLFSSLAVDFNWTTTEINMAFDAMNESPLLASPLEAMQGRFGRI